jgi:hypothetical protein
MFEVLDFFNVLIRIYIGIYDVSFPLLLRLFEPFYSVGFEAKVF